MSRRRLDRRPLDGRKRIVHPSFVYKNDVAGQRTALPVRFHDVENALRIGMAAETDRDWLGRFFDREHAALIRFALRVGRDADEARDLVQEAFLRALLNFRKLPDCDTECRAWMMRVITNLARDRYRRRRVRELAVALFRERDLAQPPQEAFLSATAVRAALAQLSPRQRAVIALSHFDQLSTAEVSAILGIREATVRWHLKHARERLAAILGATA